MENTHCNDPDCQTCRDYYAEGEFTFKTLRESRDQTLHEAKDPPMTVEGWTFRPELNRLTYDVTDSHLYDVRLDECKTPTGLLDWIAQVNEKVWATPEVVGGLVKAMDIHAGGMRRWKK